MASAPLRAFAFAVAALLLGGCAAKPKPAAAPTQGDYDWSDYTGKYAPGATPPKDDAKPAVASATAPAATASASAAPAAGANASASAEDKKLSAAKIAGQSVSQVSPDDVANATQKVLRTKVVSTNVTVGPEYEQINVVLKNVAVQIVRPAATPDKSGPKVRSPKARHDDLAKTDSGFYDEGADVLVLVQAEKKVMSKRALAALLAQRPAKKNVRAVKPRSRA